MNFDNSQFEIKGNVERRSVEVYSFYNDILSAELSIQHPISKQSKAYIRGGEFGDSAFFYAFENVITTRIAESQMLKIYCVMALYRCLKSSCENSKNPVSAPCENETFICPKCGATMLRVDLFQKQDQKQKEGGEK